MSATLFRYTARTGRGEAVRGAMTARDATSVAEVLRSRALFVTAVRAEHPVLRSLGLGFRTRPRRVALLAFFRAFATLVRAGVGLRRALEVTIERAHDATLAETLRAVLADVEHGASLNEALGRRPRAFPPLIVAMVRAGEAGGILDDVLERLAAFLERDAVLRKRVRAALAYPAVVMVAAAGLVGFLVVRIVPMFAQMFEAFHADPPVATRVLLAVAAALQQPLVPVSALAALAASVAAGAAYRRSPAGAVALDRLVLKSPLLGALIRKTITARVMRMLGTLVRSGVELVAAIAVVAPVAGSPVYRRALDGINAELRRGESFTAALDAARVFDPMVVALVRAGEEGGVLDEMCLAAARYFESDVENAVATLGAVIEPVLIAFLGVAVGFIVFSVFIPLYSLIGSVSK